MSPSQTLAAPGLEDALALGLTAAEYELICERQGAPPNRVELAMYSLLWSEHCAYKHSRLLLRTLPTDGAAVVMGPGENAGAVDIGGGLACAMKVESHNHPSAVEPFQGAATGVGGILRDIFAVGARPVAVLDSLRFGEAQSERSRYLLEGAVAGIAHYGNSIGVPTVGGEVYFEGPYEQSCLVNVMALGIARRDALIRSAAAGAGNVVVLVGARTGRDGIGGASVLASADLDSGAQERRPSVQVGDPFEEKKLLECSLELLERDLLVSLQDLGAAGLTSAAAEMAAGGGVGMEIDVAAVPVREPGMEPFEIMVSESQERMLCVVEERNVARVLATCARWEVQGAAIGSVTGDGAITVLRDGERIGRMPVAALVDAPLYELSPQRPTAALYPPSTARLAADAGPREALLALLASANLASRRPLFEHYDCLVQSRTVRRPEEADAAVLVIDPSPPHLASSTEDEASAGKAAADAPPPADAGAAQPARGEPRPALAVSIDGNGRRVAADPYWGSVGAVLECAANLACAGAHPLGGTDNLNFGNPTKPHVAWQLVESVRGLGDACRAIEAPIVGGNVSLYNDGPAGPIYPTPVIGMVGLLPDAGRAGRVGFVAEGDAVALAGPFAPALAASELEKLRGCELPTSLAPIDIAAVRDAQLAIRDGVRDGSLASAHDIAEGGVAVALAECCLAGGRGCVVELPAALVEAAIEPPAATAPQGALAGAADAALAGRALAALFGEGAGGFVVSGSAEALTALARRTPVALVGRVGGESLEIALPAGIAGAPAGSPVLVATLADMRVAHGALGTLFP